MVNHCKIVPVQIEFYNCKGRGEPCMKISQNSNTVKPSHIVESSQLHEPSGIQLIVASRYRNESYTYFFQLVMFCVLRKTTAS